MTRPVRVLLSFSKPTPHSNPFVSQLSDALAERAEVSHFTWETALFGSYDVFHLHWPEMLVRSSNPAKRVGRRIALRLLLLRLRLKHIPIVWTVHNLHPHELGNKAERAVLGRLERQVGYRVFLHAGPEHETGTSTVVLHGDYRDWFAPLVDADATAAPHALLYFGQLRPYKGVESLIDAFEGASFPLKTDAAASAPAPAAAAADPAVAAPGPATAGEGAESDWRLVIAGKPQSPAYRDELDARIEATPGVSATLGFVPEPDLVRLIRSAALVVLPYKKMYNSGSALLALSLDRAILVPDEPANRQLQAEIGAQWVLLFDGTLTTDDLRRALRAVESIPADEVPDLSRRAWPDLGRQYHEVYEKLTRP